MNEYPKLHPDLASKLTKLMSECQVDRQLEVDDFVLAEHLVNCLRNLYNTLDAQDCSEASKHPDRVSHLRGRK